MENASKKHTHLKSILKDMDSVLVAFSGGVDSTFLLKAASETLGKKALAVTAVSPSLPAAELEKSKSLAQQMGMRQLLIHTQELGKKEYAANPPNRCYFCKEELYTRLVQVAEEQSIQWIADGNNKSDEGDWRPGRKAARDFGVRSPLHEAGLFKEEIRALSRQYGLPTWDEPASACLSSRLPYGEEVTPEKLRMIEEGERVLKEAGIRQVRLRHHGINLARIEVDPAEVNRFSDAGFRQMVTHQLRKIGYVYVALDLEGYRSGRLNETLGIGAGCARGEDAGAVDKK